MLLPNTTLSLSCGSVLCPVMNIQMNYDNVATKYNTVSPVWFSFIEPHGRDSVVFGSNIVVVHLDIHDWT
jgi:hypothetical protein